MLMNMNIFINDQDIAYKIQNEFKLCSVIPAIFKNELGCFLVVPLIETQEDVAVALNSDVKRAMASYFKLKIFSC